MTRPTRKPDENWAIGLLLGVLHSESPEWREEQIAPTDRPDLVLSGPAGLRVACEITQVSHSEWFQWQNDRGLRLDKDKLDESSIPREVDLWLAKAIGKKAPHVSDYLANSSASEAWLLVHGGMNKVFDFFNLEEAERYDIPLLVKAAEESTHPFKRIFIASSNRSNIVCVFPFEGETHEAPDITNPSVLKVLSIRSMEIQTRRGVNSIAIGDEFTPNRARLLPLLDPTRMQSN
ncbi:MAG: hypothetical protein ABL860_09130 [Candidatus Nitrotoga sp.]